MEAAGEMYALYICCVVACCTPMTCTAYAITNGAGEIYVGSCPRVPSLPHTCYAHTVILAPSVAQRKQ